MLYLLISLFLYPFFYVWIWIKKRRNHINRILIIQTAKIGDFICSTPLFREIKKKYPKSYLIVMVNSIVKELAELNPYIDEVIPISIKNYKGLFGKIQLANIIRKKKCDIGISLNPNLTFSIVLLWGLVPKRISILPNFSGFTFKIASKFFDYLEPHYLGQLIVETYLKMLKFIEIETSNTTKEVYQQHYAETKVEKFLNKNTTLPFIGIAISSGNKLKELDNLKIVEIINKIFEEINCYIILIGSENDSKKAEEILRYIKDKERVINAVGKFTLGELPALLKKLQVFIGVDTGITYMADALNIPIIYLVGPTDISEQRPTNNKVIIVHHRLPCYPCSFIFKTSSVCKLNTKDCIKSIQSEEVVKALTKILYKNA